MLNYSAAVLWNNLPYEAKIEQTVWSFKKLVQQEWVENGILPFLLDLILPCYIYVLVDIFCLV